MSSTKHNRVILGQIKELEQEIVRPRSWDLQGEVKAAQRPENSLLQVIADFDKNSVPVPIITQAYTSSIEDLIISRIKDKKYDDPQPFKQTKPVKKEEESFLSQEKDKAGLGDLYADQFLTKSLSILKSSAIDEAAKEEIKSLFHKVSRQLDSLTHFHYTPKPIVAEVSVSSTQIPSISFEDIGLTAESTASAAAPEEIYRKKRGRDAALMSQEELTRDDRKRLRQANKSKNRAAKKRDLECGSMDEGKARRNKAIAEDKEFNEMLKKGKRVTTGKEIREEDKIKYGSSKKFFEKMQNDALTTSKKFKKNKNL